MGTTRDSFSTRVDHDLLEGVRALADAQGQRMEALVDEAFADLLTKHAKSGARPHVLAEYQKSHARFGPLYEKLAK